MRKILVVEDSSFQRKIIRDALGKDWGEILEASNGEDALKLILSEKPDLVFSDILMPGSSGVDLLKQLREERIKIPVIIITADIQEPVRKECMDLGAVGFISKPLAGNSLSALKNLLKEYLG